ncbi:MAG: HAD-IB family phosphatase [Lachnospiraceae bacterium]|jgi:phosphatidylglycerophosphatase C
MFEECINVYDFDGTIYDGDSTFDFYKYCLIKNPKLILFLPRQLKAALQYKLGKITKTQFKEIFYSFLRRIDNIDSAVAAFWDVHEKRIQEWYKSVSKESDLIISASPDFLLSYICNKLNVQLICSVVDKHTGIYSGENCSGEEKVRRFYERYGKSISINNFYSDSQSDLPLARLAKNSFLIKNKRAVPWSEVKNEIQS